jgi:glycosyltransferase involved in cell wall biosynthesis
MANLLKMAKAESMRLIIAAENVSMRMSGESNLPLFYLKLFQARNIDVWIVCHARVRDELREMFPNDAEFQKFRFVEDTHFQALIWKISHWFPYRIQDLIFGQWIHLLTQRTLRKVVQKLIKQEDIQIVFEPAPISPKGLSFMYALGVPVVIGPLCGGLEFPPAFRYMDSTVTRLSINFGRTLSEIAHRWVPGKLQAESLIVANERTAKALPDGYQGKVYEVVESGVDLSICKPIERLLPGPEDPIRFIFWGRFVDWKGIQFLVQAFKQVTEQTNAILELIGDGELMDSVKTQVTAMGISDRVNFHGRLSRVDSITIIRRCHVFVIPSLRECGGNAILEIMAMGLPVVATNWAGPANYVAPTCGILVDPNSIDGFVNGLAAAMMRLAESPELRQKMGDAGIKRVKENYFDWESKADRILEICHATLGFK